MAWILAPLALATLGAVHQDVRPVAFYVQGMSCEDCVRQVQTALGKVPSLTALDLELKPPLATFRFASDQVSLQDVVTAVRAAGKNFDAKLVIDEAPGLPDKTLDALDRAIS